MSIRTLIDLSIELEMLARHEALRDKPPALLDELNVTCNRIHKNLHDARAEAIAETHSAPGALEAIVHFAKECEKLLWWRKTVWEDRKYGTQADQEENARQLAGMLSPFARARKELAYYEASEVPATQNGEITHIVSENQLNAPQYVTARQIIAFLQISNTTFKRWKRISDPNSLPHPAIEGGGGRADQWIWGELRPWLAEKTKHTLPEKFPTMTPS